MRLGGGLLVEGVRLAATPSSAKKRAEPRNEALSLSLSRDSAVLGPRCPPHDDFMKSNMFLLGRLSLAESVIFGISSNPLFSGKIAYLTS